ncbi:thiamine phosphate synthase [Methyloceanibacter sp.]|uniref:thiamine phosphate synthase n=1 Tax=Methyloceanibacter sp. TaxID=1965321 RepID=UPI003D6CBDC7
MSARLLDPFYPVLPDAAWVARIASEGAKFIQLRVKDMPPHAIKTEIAQALKVASAHGCQLVVNDYWREAISLGANFVHLGQGDLAGADLGTIREAGIKLGVSTHSVDELDNALAADPDYVALGPIYPTKLKMMPWRPQGLGRIQEWRSKIACPLVAIGGITLERAPEVLAAGASSAAVVTDIVMSDDPEQRTRDWIAATAPWRHLSTACPQS